MTTRSQKIKAIEELVSADSETPLSEGNQSENLVAGTSKSPRSHTENLDDIKLSLRKEFLSDSAKILKEYQKKMLKLIAPATKKPKNLPENENSDSESENAILAVSLTSLKTKETASKTTSVNSRNSP